MKIARPLLSVSLALLLGASLMAAKTALEFDNILFDFNDVTAKATGNAKGVGKGGGKEDAPRQVAITLQADDTFSAEISDAPTGGTSTITGSYARKNEFSKKLTLIPDPSDDMTGLQALVDEYAAIIQEELEDEGVTAVVSSLQATKTNIKMSIKTKKKTGTASAKLTGKLTFEGLGSIPEIGVNNVGFKLKANFKAKNSSEVLLADIEADT